MATSQRVSRGFHRLRAHSWDYFCRDWSFCWSTGPLGFPQMRKLFVIASLLARHFPVSASVLSN